MLPLFVAALLLALPGALATDGGADCGSGDPLVEVCPDGPCDKPCCYALWVAGSKLIDPLFCTV